MSERVAVGAGGRGGRERGSVTAELAVVLPGVVLVLLAVLLAGVVGAAQVSVQDSARVVARAAALGEGPPDVAGAAVTVTRDGPWLSVVVRREVPVLGAGVAVVGRATVLAEPRRARGRGEGPRPALAPARTRERGSGTVVALAVMAAGLVLLGGVAVLGTALGAQARAQTAADLAAISAARALQLGADAAEACSAAARATAGAGAALVECSFQGPDVVVEAAVRVSGARASGLLGAAATASALARAGPAR